MRWPESAAHEDSKSDRFHRNGYSFLKATLMSSSGVLTVARASPGKGVYRMAHSRSPPWVRHTLWEGCFQTSSRPELRVLDLVTPR